MTAYSKSYMGYINEKSSDFDEIWYINADLELGNNHITRYEIFKKKLSCRRETARCFVLLNISLSHSRSFKLVPFESLGGVFYSPAVVTMALSYIILEIKRDIGPKSRFFHTLLHSTPPLDGLVNKVIRSGRECHRLVYVVSQQQKAASLHDDIQFFLECHKA